MVEQRIISLVPSLTETLSAWDRTPIACTRFCERDDLAHVGGTKDPDIERIVALKPDLVVLDAEENRLEDHEALLARNLNVHVLRVRSLDDVNPSMARLAELVGAAWKPLVVSASAPERRRAFVPIWRRPWMALGQPTYGASLLGHLGIQTVHEEYGPYPEVALDDVVRLRPDIVIAPNEPYPFAPRHLAELETIAPTTFVDGKDLFWWGVRTAGALSRLGAVVEYL